MNFKLFLESADQKDVKEIIDQLPKHYQKLLKGYKFKFECGHCLKGDDGHVGLLDMNVKTITIASPMNFGRGWTLLHEIGHIVYEKYVVHDKDKLDEWQKIVRETKDKDNQNMEEQFAHAFACFFSKNKIEKFNHPNMLNFIKQLNKMTS